MAHLTDEKRKHGHVLWVNLQEELVLEGNGQILTPREPSCPDQHIPIPSSDPELIEVFFGVYPPQSLVIRHRKRSHVPFLSVETGDVSEGGAPASSEVA